jgi:hypothetical protein
MSVKFMANKRYLENINGLEKFKESNIDYDSARDKNEQVHAGLNDNGKKYYISNHVVVFILNKNKYPDNMLDHINGIKTDNRIENLREADSYQNVLNKSALKNKKSQYKGVSWVKNRNSPKKWAIATTVRGVAHSMKYFYDELEAAMGYNELVKKFHDTEFAYMNDISMGYTNNEFPNKPRGWGEEKVAA